MNPEFAFLVESIARAKGLTPRMAAPVGVDMSESRLLELAVRHKAVHSLLRGAEDHGLS